MRLTQQVKEAMTEAIQQTGSQANLANKTGISASGINYFMSGKRDIANMTVNTLEKLFPGIVVDFFPGKISHNSSEPNPTEEKLLKLFRELDPEQQLDLIIQAGVMKASARAAPEKHSKAG